LKDHHEHLFLGEPEEDLIDSLEPDQLFAAVHRALPRKQLSRGVQVALWALRVLLLMVSAAVVYAFVSGVVNGSG
jgi:hypothetical protein